ncbi:hypothetical protein QMA10_11605 [Arthrobacter sp. APC 3897]|uniref:hypothetical protein n=1 Tax=Arthrobacter sp. APC 3897 TaxID=3035204 RepID=UPI0025B53D4E|nr:hypothetical protein [Arthrobacter sp. APC 3897]MDN3482566.1 hypothetical protein [Arthrobacter sp. APC 3897]
MTPAQLFAVLRRRWYVLAGGLCCTGLAFLGLGQSAPVYAAQSDFVFVEPGHPGEGRSLTGTEPQTLIDFTAIVERRVLAGAETAKLASPTASLFGTGIRQGTSISMLDTGGQWLSSFSRPVLSVQVAAPSPEEVKAEMDRVLQQVQAVSGTLQTDAGAQPASLITVERAPEDLIISSFGKTRTGEAKALAVLGLTGFGLSCAAAAGTDALARRGWPRGKPAPTQGGRHRSEAAGTVRITGGGPLWRR